MFYWPRPGQSVRWKENVCPCAFRSLWRRREEVGVSSRDRQAPPRKQRERNGGAEMYRRDEEAPKLDKCSVKKKLLLGWNQLRMMGCWAGGGRVRAQQYCASVTCCRSEQNSRGIITDFHVLRTVLSCSFVSFYLSFNCLVCSKNNQPQL